MTQNQNNSVSGAAMVERFMRPKSIAIIGISTRPGSAGHTVLANLTLNEYPGEIYLVGRSGGEIEGRKVLTEIDQLPEGVGLAILTLPAPAVAETVRACGRRKIGAAVIFAAGFAEAGNPEAQEEVAQAARDGGVAILGPNCLGFTNFIDGLAVGFASANKVAVPPAEAGPGVALISHSGGIVGHLNLTFVNRKVPVSYTISSGNDSAAPI